MDDAELQRLHRRATKAWSRRDCPTSETLARTAAGEVSAAERERVADHLGSCADCAEEYQLATTLKPWAESVAPVRARRPFLTMPSGLAAAAVVLISVSVSVWSYRQMGEARQAADRAQAQADRLGLEVGGLKRSVDELSRPQVDMPIVDLYAPDVTRGDSARAQSEQTISVPSSARLFTLILTLAPSARATDYSLEIVSEAGSVVWRGEGLHRSRDNTITLALPQTLLPAGRYRFVLKESPAAGERPAQEYAVRLQYETR